MGVSFYGIFATPFQLRNTKEIMAFEDKWKFFANFVKNHL